MSPNKIKFWQQIMRLRLNLNKKRQIMHLVKNLKLFPTWRGQGSIRLIECLHAKIYTVTFRHRWIGDLRNRRIEFINCF